MYKKLLLCVTATLVCNNALADDWVFRGTANAWGQTPMKAPVPPSTLLTTCQTFAADDPRFKIDNFTKGSWVESFPATDFRVAVNSSFDITFNPTTHAITATQRSTPCGAVASSSSSVVVSSRSSSVIGSSSSSVAVIPVHIRGTHNSWAEGDLMTRLSADTYQICRNFTVGDASGGPRFKIDPSGGWGADAFPATDVLTSGWTKVVVNIATKTIISRTPNMAANCVVASSSSVPRSSSSVRPSN